MLDLQSIRQQFPALMKHQNGQTVAYFDGPAGSQVPQSVINAVSHYYTHHNANCGAHFATSQESDQALDAARVACADFVNARSASEIVFGPNMTSLTFALSRALSDQWFFGDEIVVSQLDHDANFTPWIKAAEEAGAVVKKINVNLDNCTLDLDHYVSLLSNRTKLVAVGAASNLTGTINPIAEIIQHAKSIGAATFIDAVHYAPHRRIDVQAWGCDYLACSAYKFFGPHVGMLWGRSDELKRLQPKKLRPAPSQPPGKWMTGTQNHEGICGMAAAIDYIADLGGDTTDGSRQERLNRGFELISSHEHELGKQLIAGLQRIPGLKIWGITREAELMDRVPTVSVTHESKSPHELATELGKLGLFTWSGNHYAVPFTEFAGLEPNGTLRLGLLHYNTAEEVDRLLKALESLC